MNLIVAVDENWGIGNENKLLVSIPEDMRFFRSETIGKTVIMGRKTLESFPQGKPLKDRENIVISKNKSAIEGVTVVSSIEDALKAIEGKKSEEVYVIGGESIYEQLLPYCDVAYVTKIAYRYQADAHFPNLDEKEDWKLVSESEEHTYYDLEYTFNRYERMK